MRLYDTLRRRTEEFTPLEPGHVRMYNCGPTVYRRNHVGNYRAFATADLLRRTFEFLGWRVTQIMNITDVGHLTEDDAADARGEDRLQKEAQARKLDPWQIAREVEGWFHEDRRKLRILDADRYPRATDHIPEMIAMIETLVKSGHAYVAGGNAYFSVGSFPRYGALSGNTVEKLDAGASGRVEDRAEKRSPHDFALWKRDPKHLMQWDSPWGRGFPGWHIECSAMSRKYLGDTFDLHTGGPDNIFPHHECEIAQSESVTGKPFVRHWAHCGWLTLGGEKMAKRTGKVHTVPELVEQGYAGPDIRLFLLKQHYRAPLPFRMELLDEAREIRKRFNNFVQQERPRGPPDSKAVEGARAKFRAALEDDVNTSEALAVLHELMTVVNRTGAGATGAVAFLREADKVFAILDEPLAAKDEEIERLMADREAARKSRDFEKADAIRDELLRRGIELLDTPQGTRWRRK